MTGLSGLPSLAPAVGEQAEETSSNVWFR